jgi:putative phosphoribosyl transferase
MARTSSVAETHQGVQIAAGSARLEGDLHVPASALGIVVFAHGSGSGRHSPRNRFVAEQLYARGLATLLFDLLTEAEERQDRYTGELRFNIELLAERLVRVTEWVVQHGETAHLPIGYFGASTGGGAALVAAARMPDRVSAVVSRGGRPDLASDALADVQAATLLIVGGDDPVVIELNQQAFDLLRPSRKEIVIVPGASHLFEEPGKLEEVARLAGDWFTRFLNGGA